MVNFMIFEKGSIIFLNLDGDGDIWTFKIGKGELLLAGYRGTGFPYQDIGSRFLGSRPWKNSRRADRRVICG